MKWKKGNIYEHIEEERKKKWENVYTQTIAKHRAEQLIKHQIIQTPFGQTVQAKHINTCTRAQNVNTKQVHI